MIVCPVCEHPQALGTECEVCGKRLSPAAAAVPPVPAVEGLEPTRLDPGGQALPPADRLAELEPTRHRPVNLSAAEPALDVEPTRAPPADVDAPPLPDLERTGTGIPGDAPTALPLNVLCRYCRTPATPGERLCARCGMRLPIMAESTTAREDARPAGGICGYGARVTGPRCPSCGARQD
jgi:hypothetical protein